MCSVHVTCPARQLCMTEQSIDLGLAGLAVCECVARAYSGGGDAIARSCATPVQFLCLLFLGISIT